MDYTLHSSSNRRTSKNTKVCEDRYLCVIYISLRPEGPPCKDHEHVKDNGY